MRQLRSVSNAILDNRKITQHLLSTVYSTGASKAKSFMSFGFSLGNWAELKSALLNHPQNNAATSQASNSFGQKFEVRCALVTPDGRTPCIMSVWIIEPPDPNPRFITAYPTPERASSCGAFGS